MAKSKPHHVIKTLYVQDVDNDKDDHVTDDANNFHYQHTQTLRQWENGTEHDDHDDADK